MLSTTASHAFPRLLSPHHQPSIFANSSGDRTSCGRSPTLGASHPLSVWRCRLPTAGPRCAPSHPSFPPDCIQHVAVPSSISNYLHTTFLPSKSPKVVSNAGRLFRFAPQYRRPRPPTQQPPSLRPRPSRPTLQPPPCWGSPNRCPPSPLQMTLPPWPSTWFPCCQMRQGWASCKVWMGVKCERCVGVKLRY